MSDDSPATLRVADGVALITLNRPLRHNAWTDAMGEAYFAHLASCEADQDVRAVVVTGAGAAYCVGGEFEELRAFASDRSLGENPIRRARHSVAATLRVPVIAAINGSCAGIGLVQALWCDVRFATRGAKLATAYARRGLPAEQGLSWLLTRTVGVSRAADLLLSGRTVTGAGADRLGLVSAIADDGADVLAHALDYARDIARSCAPTAVAAIKRQLWEDLDAHRGAALDRSIQLTDEFVAGDDFAEGLASFLERRPPQFGRQKGLPL